MKHSSPARNSDLLVDVGPPAMKSIPMKSILVQPLQSPLSAKMSQQYDKTQKKNVVYSLIFQLSQLLTFKTPKFNER